MAEKQTPKERRELRKLEKQQLQQQKNIRHAQGVIVQRKAVRIQEIPNIARAKPLLTPTTDYRETYFSWCCTQGDNKGTWSWKEPRVWTEAEYQETIEFHLNQLANSSWKEVESFDYNGAGGYRKLLNKYQPLDSICEEAQERWIESDILCQFETLFRLRLGSNKRIWGIRVNHHFFMVWYERHHQICPIEE